MTTKKTPTLEVLQKRLIGYNKFLRIALESGWYILPLTIVNLCDLEDKVLGVYHFIDGSKNISLYKEMAILERAMGLSTTYFFSNAIPIPNSVEMMKFLLELGHEPALHLTILSNAIALQKIPQCIVNEVVNEYRKEGFKLDGVMCSEEPPIQHMKVTDFSFFSEGGKEKRMEVGVQGGQQFVFYIGVHPLAEYGFTYSPNNMEFENTFSDKDQDVLLSGLKTEKGRSSCIMNPQHWEIN